VALLPVYDMEMYMYVIAMFVLFYIHVLLFSASWQYNTVGTQAVLIYTGIPMTYFLEWVFIGRVVTILELAGAFLIFATNISIVSLRLFKYIK
jgi:drug/metabolite transporter (DMT)-like permease